MTQAKCAHRSHAALAKTSSDMALRDLNDLVERGVLDKAPAAGRGARYLLGEMNRHGPLRGAT